MIVTLYVWVFFMVSSYTMYIVAGLSCHTKYDMIVAGNVTFNGVTNATQLHDVRTLLRCTSLCGEMSHCVSVVYEIDNRQCSLYNQQAVSILPGHGLKYAKVSKSSCKVIKHHGEKCHVPDDCISPNSACASVCTCEPGFSYNSTIATCAPNCVSYGTTFEEHIGFYLLGYNNRIIHNINMNSCLELCISTTSFTCRTAELSRAGTCYLSEHTAITQPAAYRTSSQYTLWQRNCDIT